nr:MAG TPA: hypothetical protein [Caudoviricetes sp.]
MESEYYSKIYEKLDVNLTKNHLVELSTLVKSKIITGHTPSMKNEKFYDGKINFIKTDNLRDNFIKEPFSDYLSELGDEKIKNSRLKEFDIITTIIGATYKIIGRSCLVNTTMLPSNINQNIALIRANIKKINPYYLNVYMQSLYGKLYLHWLSRQTEQVNLNCEEVGKLKVARFSSSFEENLATLNKKSYELNIISNEKYSQAENLLIAELGLENFNPSSEKVSIKTLKESFLKTGRLDSEYYQPKYDRLFEKLSDNNCDKLSNLVTIEKSIEPGSESYHTKGTPFIRVQDLTKFGLTDTSIYLSENEFKDCIRPKKDTILLSKDGTVGIAYKMNKEEDFITSSAILHLNVKNERVLPDYLTLVLNSIVVKMQAEKDAGGSIINHWKKNEIENVIIPIISKEKQEQISKLLIESEKLRVESKSILEKAVKSVEMAIEYGEEKAIVYLNA